MEIRVEMLAAANKIWLVSENFSPIATVDGSTSQAWRFQPNFTWVTSITITKAVVGNYSWVRKKVVEEIWKG